jgi:hypothetical protein
MLGKSLLIHVSGVKLEVSDKCLYRFSSDVEGPANKAIICDKKARAPMDIVYDIMEIGN